jgi:thiol-disulfide isomerase/thioredoxin
MSSVVSDDEILSEKNDHHNHNDKENNPEEDWIPTRNGGFLPRWGQSKTKRVPDITTLEDYKREVAQEHDKLVVVRFYAPWCRACKAIANSFSQLPHLYPHVKFVQVPLNKDTTIIHTGMGVPSLPYGHIYHPDVGLVEERKISRNHFRTFRDEVLQTYVDGYCPVQYSDDGSTNWLDDR